MTIYLPVIFHRTRLRIGHVGGRGGRNQSSRMNIFLRDVWAERDRLSVEEQYRLLPTHAAKRRVQEMLLEFIEFNGGKVVKLVPKRPGYYFVLVRSEALKMLGKKLYEGPNPMAIDDIRSIGTFPVDEDDMDDTFDLTDINF